MLKLEDVTPMTGKFTLKQTGKEYSLRPFNLSDEIWLRQTFGEKLAVMFGGGNIDALALCQIAFHQLEDRTDFKKIEKISFDENGDEIKESIGGVALLMSLVQGMAEKVDILLAITETLGVSRAKVQEMADKAETDQKKKDTKKPTGHISSTP